MDYKNISVIPNEFDDLRVPYGFIDKVKMRINEIEGDCSRSFSDLAHFEPGNFKPISARNKGNFFMSNFETINKHQENNMFIDRNPVNTRRDQIEKTRKNLENKVFDRLINPEDQSINIEPRQGYGIKERKALEKAIDRLNQLAQ